LNFIEALYFRPVFSFWSINKEELTQKLLAIASYADYSLLCKMIFYQMLHGKEKIMLFCDKNPENSLHIKILLKVFPEAKFIHMVRDPRDSVNSHSRSFGKKDIYIIARSWVGYNVSIQKIKEKTPLKFHTLLYEELIVNTKNTLVSLCEFLDVPFSDSMMKNRFMERMEDMKQNKFFKRMEKIHQSLLEPINIKNIGKWEREMNSESIAITEAIAGPLARNKYGYTMSLKSNFSGKISYYKLFASYIQYRIWELFTRLRYKSYRINKIYYTRKMVSRPMGV
jgi:protein-tyrosine sulfotransferase